MRESIVPQTVSVLTGQPDFLVLKPRSENRPRAWRQTGKRYPTLERSPNVQRQGQRSILDTQCCSKFRKRGSSFPPGTSQEAMLTAPLEPRVSDQQVSSMPCMGPLSTFRPSVRADWAIGMMMAKRSTRREPSCRSSAQPASSASSRNRRMAWMLETLTSRSSVAFLTMNVRSEGKA